METHHITPARGLSETGLKWIALVTMVLDHIHYFFSFTGCVPEWFSMVGRLGAPLFLFCLVEGFTHTHSRKRYFARVYVLSTAMSLLFFFMAFAHVLVRPDGFYPANGMMTTFVILMVMFQGIDWLGRRHIVRGLAALLLPLAWPFLASALSLAVPALATPVGLAALLRSPRLGHHRGQQLAGAGHGAGALPVPPEPEGAGTGLRRVLFSLRGGVYGPHGLPDARFRLEPALHPVLRDLRHPGRTPHAVL